jgi:hypothetical protein
VPSPRNYRPGVSAQIEASIDPGVGVQTYSLPPNAKLASSMNFQPAFALSAPMQNESALPDTRWLESLMFGKMLPNFGGGGLPTFFPVGNRSANSQDDPWSGKPNGLRMLVVPPTRYNAVWRTKRTRKDVRATLSQPLPSRSGTPYAPAGS